ncbi:MAG: hypothetical protein JWM36_4340 [Hyphomicrobiales bacterium]|nr:hypothetical protein [Hyphomicrobiales bacterium]
MPSASLSLQKAVVGKLKADIAVSALVGTSVFDTPNADVFPRITLGEDQVLTERADCYEGDEVILTIHAWSREIGFPQVKRIGSAVRAALQGADLTLDDYRLVDIAVEDERYMRDPDGITSHAVLTFRALTEPTD